MRARKVAATLLLVATAAAISTADAQPVPVNPVPQGSPIPRVLPPTPPSVAPGTVIPPPSAPGVEVPNRPVRVSSVEVEGVTAYSQPEIAQLAAGLIGPAVPLPQIDAARQAILQRYRSDGYVLTTVAANLDANGRLRFVVTEGRIASVKLDGDIGPAGTQVLRFLNRLTEKQPINSVTLERYLLLAQDVPGVSLRAVLEPSADTPGALNLIAQVSRQKVSGLARWIIAPSIKPGRSSFSAWLMPTASPSLARRRRSRYSTPSRTARISARSPPRLSSAHRASRGGFMAVTAAPPRPALWVLLGL